MIHRLKNKLKSLSMNIDGNIIGFDFGTKYIGISLGDTMIRNARGISSIHRKNKRYDWEQITQLINKWEPAALVVGQPLTLDGKEQEISRLAAKFANQLRGRYNLNVFEVDERLTSRLAQDIIKNTEDKRFAKKKHKDAKDQVAAQIILQTWFDETNE